MADAPAGWYPDPMNRHELRYWDGARWTEHVAARGVQGVDVPAPAAHGGALGSQADVDARTEPSRAPVLGSVGLLLCLVAVVSVVVCVVAFARSSSGPSVGIGDGPVHVTLPAHRTYGIYIDDADNSGYFGNCSARDGRDEREIPMRDPGWSISSSDTETLDFAFDTGSGDVSITCSVSDARVRVGPVPHFAMLLGVAAGVLGGVVGGGMLLAWAVIRSSRRRLVRIAT